MEISIIFKEARDASPELLDRLLDDYIAAMHYIEDSLRTAAQDVDMMKKLYPQRRHGEWRIMDQALEEMCAHFRPKYSHYKTIVDWLYDAPRQAGPCLAECKQRLAALVELKGVLGSTQTRQEIRRPRGTPHGQTNPRTKEKK